MNFRVCLVLPLGQWRINCSDCVVIAEAGRQWVFSELCLFSS